MLKKLFQYLTKPILIGTGPFYTDNYQYRVLKISIAPGEKMYDVFYDHGKNTTVYKDRVKFYYNGDGCATGCHTIKSMTTGHQHTENKRTTNKKPATRMVSILLTVDYELRRNSYSTIKSDEFNIVEDSVAEKLDKLGL